MTNQMSPLNSADFPVAGSGTKKKKEVFKFREEFDVSLLVLEMKWVTCKEWPQELKVILF